ncbi:C-C chemokine receptor type 10 [Esox lucius]|uniref:G-protein coupled receptors family 1 profile domain-containing protein n=1 Tax=Esox lucius TaxID=8010 RepID=A0A3P8XPF6_ESOLU|nr:C-C chemokine receptor type 10 [Esox lucius]XP_019901962.1 C-C chemokine receptor type 10 [Esox lucius]
MEFTTFFPTFDDYTFDFNYNISTTDNELPELCEANEQQLTIKMFQTSIFLLVLLLGVLGNCLVITTFVLYRRLRLRSMTDIFLFQLALADLLLLLTLPLQAGDVLLGRWAFGDALCKLTRASYAVNTYSGLLLLACISVDRYVVVAWAQAMLRLRSRMLTGAKLASMCVWLAALLLSLPEVLFSGVDKGGAAEEGEAHCGMKVWLVESWRVKMAASGAQIAGFCLPFLVMVSCYSLIGRVLWEKRGTGASRRQRTLRLMVTLVAVFLLFQLPYAVVLTLKLAGPGAEGQTCAQRDETLLMEYVTCTLAYTRCCLNPLLYALVGVRFRSDVRKLLHKAGVQFRVGTGSHTESCSSGSPTSPGLTTLSPLPPTSPLPRPPTSPPPLPPHTLAHSISYQPTTARPHEHTYFFSHP